MVEKLINGKNGEGVITHKKRIKHELSTDSLRQTGLMKHAYSEQYVKEGIAGTLQAPHSHTTVCAHLI